MKYYIISNYNARSEMASDWPEQQGTGFDGTIDNKNELSLQNEASQITV